MYCKNNLKKHIQVWSLPQKEWDFVRLGKNKEQK